MRSIHHFLILLSVLILTLDLMLEKLLQWDLVGTQWEYGGNVVGVDRELIGSSYGAGTKLACLLSCPQIAKSLPFYSKTCIQGRMDVIVTKS